MSTVASIERVEEQATEAPRTLKGRTGAQAELVTEEGIEVLRVRDARGMLLLEHRPEEGRTIVHAPDGALDFVADRIGLEAREGVRIRAGNAVDLSAGHAVRLGTDAGPGRAATWLSLGARGLTAAAAVLEARAGRAELGADEARLTARTLVTAVETARHVAGLVDLDATRIVERAVDVYREARELSQMTAGRIRLAASQALYALGRETWVEGEEGLKLRGDKVHIG